MYLFYSVTTGNLCTFIFIITRVEVPFYFCLCARVVVRSSKCDNVILLCCVHGLPLNIILIFKLCCWQYWCRCRICWRELFYAIGIFYILLLFADSKLVFISIGALLIERAHCVWACWEVNPFIRYCNLISFDVKSTSRLRLYLRCFVWINTLHTSLDTPQCAYYLRAYSHIVSKGYIES